MVPLDHEIWDRLTCHCITGRKFAAILADYYDGRIPEGDEIYEDLLECACGGDVYSVSYAAAPHLVVLAGRVSNPVSAAAMLAFAAGACVDRTMPGAPAVDPLLERDLDCLPAEALTLAQRVLTELHPTTDVYPWHKATICAFEGKVDECRNRMRALCERPVPTQEIKHESYPRFRIQGPSDTFSNQ